MMALYLGMFISSSVPTIYTMLPVYRYSHQSEDTHTHREDWYVATNLTADKACTDYAYKFYRIYQFFNRKDLKA